MFSLSLIQGVRRAEQTSQSADLRVCVQDLSAGADYICTSLGTGTANCNCLLQQPHEIPTIVVLNKLDLTAAEESARASSMETSTAPHASHIRSCHAVSCRTREGIDSFLGALQAGVSHCCSAHSEEGPIVAHARHRAHLQVWEPRSTPTPRLRSQP